MSSLTASKSLLVIPIMFACMGTLLTSIHGPYYFGNNFDPDYCYLFNSVNLLTFHAPGHTDHPGTTLQEIGAIVVFLRWLLTAVLGTRAQSLASAVLGNPEAYLFSINLVLNLLVAAGMYLAAAAVSRLTGSLWVGFVFELSALPFLQTLLALTRVSPEPLLVATGLLMTAPLATAVMGKCSNREISRSAVLAGCLFGFGVVTKITFLPWVLVVFLYSEKRDRIHFLVAGLVSTLVFLVPVYGRIPAMAQWFVSLLLHKDRYGKGAIAFPTVDTLLQNVFAQARDEPFLFLSIAIYGVVLLAFFLGLVKFDRPQAPRVLWVGCAVILVEVLMVAKHPAPHYIVPALLIPALINATLGGCLVRLNGAVSLKQNLAIGAAVLISCGIAFTAKQASVWLAGTAAYVDAVRGMLQDQKTSNGCEYIGMYRSSLPDFALAFGDDFAAGAQAGELQRLHPGLVYFNIFAGHFFSANYRDELQSVVKDLHEGKCVLLQGTRIEPSVLAEMKGLLLQEIGAGAGEVLYKAALDPTVLEPLMRTLTFPEGTILREAEDFQQGNVVPDRNHWGVGIGVITAPIYPAYAEYRVIAPIRKTYDIYVRYASADARSLVMSMNSEKVSGNVCSEPTGGYEPQYQSWQKAGTAELRPGENVLRLERSGPFPHVDKFALIPR